MGVMLPKLYAIVDAGCFASGENWGSAVVDHALALVAGGVTLLQYRSKTSSAREMLVQARELRRAIHSHIRLVMNDRADLCLAAGFDGVHLGQDDLSPVDVRAIVGAAPLIGLSTHNPEQVRFADTLPVDYVAVGPVFSTARKRNPDPVIGLDGVHVARRLTAKPLVAIGGITRANCQAVIDAGADSVAVISDLLSDPRRAATEFLQILS
jgi:thiamine-phosphate pyrophosphorylase